MKQMRQKQNRFRLPVMLLLCAILITCVPLSALAEESSAAAEPETETQGNVELKRAPDTEIRVLDADEVQALFDAYMAEKDLSPQIISVGYVYTPTGETWFWNEDRGYYSASLYKLPLMMLYAEQEYRGEITQDTEFYGVPLSRLEELILTESNNEYAYLMLTHMASSYETRNMMKKWSDIQEEEFSWDFTGSSFFTAHYMTDVLKTLYYNEEHFPHIVERLLDAQPDHYFRYTLHDEYPVAQKYGNYNDGQGNAWNHNAGIVYTPNPFLLTVMTKYDGIYEIIISDLAVIYKDYTLMLDMRYEQALQKQKIREEQLAAELAAEAERLAYEARIQMLRDRIHGR